MKRSDSSIEYKFHNVSAVLFNFHQPFIAGFKPLQHYQQLLEQVVLQSLEMDPEFFRRFENGPVLTPTTRPRMPGIEDLADLIVDPPEMQTDVLGSIDEARAAVSFKTDFVQRDAANRELGHLGEEWVLEFEQRRLHDLEHRPDLAKGVEWIALTKDDGAGYDISPFNANGTPRLIEVKTTGLGKYFPFLVTANELKTSQRETVRYHLYRVFGFSTKPQVYVLQGPLSEVCRLEPASYQARLATGRAGPNV